MPMTGKVNDPIVNYDMADAEAIGLLKHDILGVRMLSKMALTTEYVYQRTGKYITNVPKTPDKEVFKMIGAGDVLGLFQLEGSPGIRQLCIDAQPKSITDLSAVVALYRSGPRDSGMLDQYLENKDSRDWEPLHPLLLDILRDSYGVIIYQEQCMSAFRILANYSIGESDLIRRAISKKKVEELAAKKSDFIKRAQEHARLTEQEATEIFEAIETWSGYGFNRAHSASYATLAYQSAWFKYHYPLELMSAIIEHENNFEQTAIYIIEARNMGYKILPPDINAAEHQAHPVGGSSGQVLLDQPNEVRDDTIMLGLKNIKGISGSIEIPAGTFDSLYDFCYRVDMNKRHIETLIRAGVFDSIEPNRNQLLQQLPGIIKAARAERKTEAMGQGMLFELPEVSLKETDVTFTDDERYPWEYELYGTYLAGHPLEQWEEKIKRNRTHSSAEVMGLEEGDHISIGGRIRDALFLLAGKLIPSIGRSYRHHARHVSWRPFGHTPVSYMRELKMTLFFPCREMEYWQHTAIFK